MSQGPMDCHVPSLRDAPRNDVGGAGAGAARAGAIRTSVFIVSVWGAVCGGIAKADPVFEPQLTLPAAKRFTLLSANMKAAFSRFENALIVNNIPSQFSSLECQAAAPKDRDKLQSTCSAQINDDFPISINFYIKSNVIVSAYLVASIVRSGGDGLQIITDKKNSELKNIQKLFIFNFAHCANNDDHSALIKSIVGDFKFDPNAKGGLLSSQNMEAGKPISGNCQGARATRSLMRSSSSDMILGDFTSIINTKTPGDN